MISEADRNVIATCARKYDVSALYLFGSSLRDPTHARDIDLAVKGINPTLFFKFYGELMRRLSKPVDLVDLSQKTLFNALVEERGVKIYG
ncbi:nucleotidyltransferase domain-containing protein [candidate division KSB1 bacterium]|nr:nucleotidyltransferase domain-containing protein [candidate division KSB1 bacterium]